ncbi:zinc finger protein ZAT11-like [Magnolia sinica]|uniref:zinc finger protein ZAT11-like n=1 Tax=Magnolia sinica TaxID=86752 RepID=UPI00265AD0DB|nr:zinc finger protein ZAT11-like [Magnolia sinica]XP_058109796.1 zinc finger protein ZAT11-like [Magnolia sinica]
MKHMRDDREMDMDGEMESIRTANFLMLLARGNETERESQPLSRVFECKTCNRQFPSFQALGGHRASHKKPRLLDDHHGRMQNLQKPKVHECSICGLEFAIGQALGGHMRRHRNTIEGFSEVQPVVKRSNSRRIFSLDLNLTPDENESNIMSGVLGGKISLVH